MRDGSIHAVRQRRLSTPDICLFRVLSRALVPDRGRILNTVSVSHGLTQDHLEASVTFSEL